MLQYIITETDSFIVLRVLFYVGNHGKNKLFLWLWLSYAYILNFLSVFWDISHWYCVKAVTCNMSKTSVWVPVNIYNCLKHGMNKTDKTMLVANYFIWYYLYLFLGFLYVTRITIIWYKFRNGIKPWKNVVTQTQKGSLQFFLLCQFIQSRYNNCMIY